MKKNQQMYQGAHIYYNNNNLLKRLLSEVVFVYIHVSIIENEEVCKLYLIIFMLLGISTIYAQHTSIASMDDCSICNQTSVYYKDLNYFLNMLIKANIGIKVFEMDSNLNNIKLVEFNSATNNID